MLIISLQAGLFSAILSAFVVQSYQLLQPAPSDQTNALLAQVSNQLASFRTSAPFTNSTQPAYKDLIPSPPQFVAPTYAIWMNTLWFVSLVFSLASATIGIIVKQWIKEYNTGLYGSSREIARRRQYRLNSLEKWHVAEIVAIVPFLLLIALVLFLAGLVILLHSLQGTVASITSFFIGCLLLFVVATTVFPTVFKSCCYYSPQAYALFRLLLPAFPVYLWISRKTITGLFRFFDWISHHDRSREWALKYMSDSVRRKEGFGRRYQAYAFFKRLSSRVINSPVWREGEQAVYTDNPELDASTMITAYEATLDTKTIDDSITNLTGSASAAPWGQYIAALNDVLCDRGSSDTWPNILKSKFATLLHFAKAARSESFVGESERQGFSSNAVDIVEGFTYDEGIGEGMSPDRNLKLSALIAVNWRLGCVAQADKAWDRHVYGTEMKVIRDSDTYRTGAYPLSCHH